MARKLTIKQEAFARAYVETGNASEAYRRAYNAEKTTNEVIWVKACELLKNGNVSVRVEELQAKAAERHEVTVDSLTEKLEEAFNAGMDEKSSVSAAVSAVMGIAKLHGLVIDRAVNQNTNATIDDKPASKEDWLAEHSTPSKARATNGHMETAGRPPARTH